MQYADNLYVQFKMKQGTNVNLSFEFVYRWKPPYSNAVIVWHACSHSASVSCSHHLHPSFPTPHPTEQHNGPVQSDPYLPNKTRLWKDPYQVAANASVGPREWKMLPDETAWVSGPCEQKAVQSLEKKGRKRGWGGVQRGGNIRLAWSMWVCKIRNLKKYETTKKHFILLLLLWPFQPFHVMVTWKKQTS